MLNETLVSQFCNSCNLLIKEDKFIKYLSTKREWTKCGENSKRGMKIWKLKLLMTATIFEFKITVNLQCI